MWTKKQYNEVLRYTIDLKNTRFTKDQSNGTEGTS